MKIAFVEATVHDIKGQAHYSGKGRGSRNAVAIFRAFDRVLVQIPKGKRFSTITARVVLTTEQKPKEEKSEEVTTTPTNATR